MTRVHIVTDSGARFGNPRLLDQYPVTIVPNIIEVDGVRYREDVDIDAEALAKLIADAAQPPVVIPPSVNDYAAVYASVSRTFDGIVSIHTSRELSRSWHNAREAAQQLADSCEISVIDSRTVCAAQGILVRAAAKATSESDDFEWIVQAARGAVERVYSMYFVTTLNALRHNDILSASHAILGTMQGIRPLLSMEEGELIIIEKVRSRSQAIDHLLAFITEFDELDDAVIVQNRMQISDATRTLQDRLTVEFPGQHFPFAMYGATLASLLGPDAVGVAVLEKEFEGFGDNG